MRGEILAYDDGSGKGWISGDDGQRYTFARSDLQQSKPIGAGSKVDFVPVDKLATEIFLVGVAPAQETVSESRGTENTELEQIAAAMFPNLQDRALEALKGRGKRRFNISDENISRASDQTGISEDRLNDVLEDLGWVTQRAALAARLATPPEYIGNASSIASMSSINRSVETRPTEVLAGCGVKVLSGTLTLLMILFILGGLVSMCSS